MSIEHNVPGIGFGFFSATADPAHFARLRDGFTKTGYFTDRALFDRVSVGTSDLVLVLTPDRVLAFAAHVRPSRNGSTGAKGFKAESIVDLGIQEADLASTLPPDVWKRVSRAFEQSSFRPNASDWQILWQSLYRLRPAQADGLRRLEQLRFDAMFNLERANKREEQVYFEKDAVGVALAVAGIPFSTAFAELSKGLAESQSLVRSLCGNPIEDVFIDHDIRNFPGFIRAEDVLDACVMRQNDKKLTIINVNRRRGEAALGVDLIYWNPAFKSFTFVQYKMLEPEGTQANREWRYRPDEQFMEEIRRMSRAHGELSMGPGQDPLGYRIGLKYFFVKFCKRVRTRVNSGELGKGCYMTVQHLQLVLAAAKGPRGGGAIALSNMGRWLTRTTFTSLVADGWVGTTGVDERQLGAIVERLLDAGRSVVVAVGNA
jgi:hypothetical protein